MSDEAVSQPEDTVSRTEFNNLQEQLKAARAERDREKFEKAEIVAKANAFAKERDELRAKLDEAVADTQRLRNARNADAQKLEAAERDLEAAKNSFAEAAGEAARLREQIETTPSAERLAVIWQLTQDQTKAAHDWVRSKIPADSPILPWFDKAVAMSLQIGCTAVKLSREFIAWATPRAIELFNKGKAELEARLAKK